MRIKHHNHTTCHIMTFYWWSHWFWITLLASSILSFSLVHTYPSQEVSSEYNAQDVKSLKPVTKLYQATTMTFTWAATAPPSNQQYSSTGNTKLQSVTPTLGTALEMANISNVDEMYDDESSSSEELEFKRSAEVSNKTHEVDRPSEPEADGESSVKSNINAEVSEAPALKSGEVNNYTNFSSEGTRRGINESTSNVNSHSPEIPANQTDSLNSSRTFTRMPAGAIAATPSTPKIESTNATVPWHNGLPALTSNQTDSVASSSELINAIDNPSEITAHKVPFTLENVNKEEELRRAETDHRSRKSKVLSAEYRHINRYINYSADSKNLLARSASTAPNEFEGDESNISSEALAIQRTYFLDAGAISAICFTVFGVCCTVGTIGIVLYRRRYLNKPQALSEPDSSVYIDDSTMRVSDNSDEMYSLDNDSFLNSLEAMTIQNYWTDTVKHTKL